LAISIDAREGVEVNLQELRLPQCLLREKVIEQFFVSPFKQVFGSKEKF